MMHCRQATQLASESLERKLRTGEKLELKLHLAMCSACRNFNRQVQTLRDIARDYAKGSEPAGDDTPTANKRGD